MIEVMWIDDEWEDKGVPFIASAENEGINIAPFDTSDIESSNRTLCICSHR